MESKKFHQVLQDQVLIIDGAMGTMVQDLFLPDSAYGGTQFSMLSDLLVFSRPEEVKTIHLKYFKAGSNAVETNTFGASPLRLQEFDFKQLNLSGFPPQEDGEDLSSLKLNDFCYRLNKQASEIANRALKEYKSSAAYDGRPLFVLGSIGPSNWVLSSTEADLNKGNFDQIEDNFYQQTCGLIDGGADVLLFETQQDILELKVAVLGAKKAMEEKQVLRPIICQVTVDQFAKMQIFNTDIHAALICIQEIGIDVFGINCSIGPDLMVPIVKKIAQISPLPISVIPNAGLPVSEAGKTVFKLSPADLAKHLKTFVSESGVNIVGGCCGTTPKHIQAIVKELRGISPKSRKTDKGLYVSGPQNAVKIDGKENLIRIGERLNVRGSKKVRLAVENESGELDQSVLEDVISEQTRDLGIEIIDVCMDSNLVDTPKTLVEVIQGQTVNFSGAMCIDSFDVKALEEAIKVYPGRPIINSISLEEYAPGVDKIDAVLEVTHKHAPLYICLATGPKGPAMTADEKFDLAEKIVKKVTSQYNVKPEQLLIDINAFPIGAESVAGMNFSMESINSIPRIKKIHPDLKLTIGVGNLTNGLANKPYMRKVLTSVFLDEARKVGLDAAIINPNHYIPVESLPKEDYEIGLLVIRNRDMEAFEKLEEIALLKKGEKVVKRSTYADLDLIPAVCEKIKDGFKSREIGEFEFDGYKFVYKDRIVFEVAKIIKNIEPLILINDYLMVAMEELGDGFAIGEVSLPHLLKSADVMKHVMGFLESYMQKKTGKDIAEEIQYKGTIVLGTVYQDVHSIGKDLTKTLLENYGYRVIDLGVQVPLDQFIENAKKHNANAVGMSALLVQTSNHMITVSGMMDQAGLKHLDILIGGAPVNHRHAAYVAMSGEKSVEKIKNNVFYCGSAMDGVNVLNALMDKDRRTQLLDTNESKLKDSYEKAVRLSQKRETLLKRLPRRKTSFSSSHPKMEIFPNSKHVKIKMTAFLPYLNENVLYSLNWKYGGKGSWARKGVTKKNLEAQLKEWAGKSEINSWVEPQGIMGVFPAKAIDENRVVVFSPKDKTTELGRFHFNDIIGEGKKDIFSIAQYFKKGEFDLIGLQITTGGCKVDQAIQIIKQDDQSDALILQGLSDRVAEDMAQYVHEMMDRLVGISEHTGARYSPGYPAMTGLENNLIIAKLLDAENILGISLTDAHEFYPTGTTAAVACFHPDARYK